MYLCKQVNSMISLFIAYAILHSKRCFIADTKELFLPKGLACTLLSQQEMLALFLKAIFYLFIVY